MSLNTTVYKTKNNFTKKNRHTRRYRAYTNNGKHYKSSITYAIDSDMMLKENTNSIIFFLYNTIILATGLTSFLTITYNTTSIDDDMAEQDRDRNAIIIHSCIPMQFLIWLLYVCGHYDFDNDATWRGLSTLAFTILGWIASVVTIGGVLHTPLICAFMTSFVIFTLSLFNLTRDEENIQLLRVILLFEIVCIVTMMVLFNNKDFDLMEGVSFGSFSLISLIFFIFNQPYRWKKIHESYKQPYEYEM